MTEIEKLKEGRALSKNEYTLAKALFQEAYANADAAMKLRLDALMLSSQNYSAADPMNNRSAREFATLMYRNATAVALGEYSAAPTATASTKNIFNGYSTNENISNANTLTSRFLKLNSGQPTALVAGSSPTTSVALPAASGTGGNYYQFKWNRSIGSSWGLDTESFESRFTRFVDGLAKELTAAKEAKEAGKTIRGLASGTENEFEGMLTFLNDLKTNVESRDRKESMSKLLRLAGPLKIDEDGFKTFFGEFLPQATEADKNRELRRGEGYRDLDISGQSQYVLNLAKNNKFHFMTKDGQTFAFDQNYNLVTNPFAEIDDDYTTEGQQGSSYGHGLFIDANGNVFMGDTSQIGEGHQWKQALDDFVTKMNRRGLFMKKNWELGDSYSEDELTNQLAEKVALTYPLLSRYSFTDVGAMFAGNANVIAFDPTGKELGEDRFGNIKFTPTTKFAYIDSNGVIQLGSLLEVELNVGKYKRSGYLGESNNGTLDTYSMKGIFDNAELLDSSTNYLRYGLADFGRSFLFDGITLDWPAFLYGVIRKLFGNLSIGHNLQEFVNCIIQALNNPSEKIEGSVIGTGTDMTGREYLDWLGWSSGNKEKILATVGNMVTSGSVSLTPEQRKIFQQKIKENYTSLIRSKLISALKLGGILKMAYGDTIRVVDGQAVSAPKASWHERFDLTSGIKKMEADAAKARELGYDNLRQMDAAKNTEFKWTTSDTLRTAALAQDVAGLVAAISTAATGGAGSIAAEVTGFTSMGTDLVADILDPAVSKSDVVKNAVINTALGAGAFVGAKAPKIIKSAMKIVPHIMMVAGAAGVAFDDDVQHTVLKLTTGKESLNTQDWKNIYMILKMGTGLGTGAAMGVSNRRALKKISKNTEVKSVDSVLDPNKTYLENPSGGKPIEIPKEKAAEIKKLLSEGKADEAKTKLQDLKADDGTSPLLTDAQIDDLTDISRDWKRFFKKNNAFDNEVKAKEVTSNDPEKLQELIAAEQRRVYGASGNKSKWQKDLAKLDELSLKLLHPIDTFNGKTIVAPKTAVELAAMRNAGINSLSARGAKELEGKLLKLINDLPYAFDESAFNTTFDEKNIAAQTRAARKAAGSAEATSATHKDHAGNDVDIKTADKQRRQASKEIELLGKDKKRKTDELANLDIDNKQRSYNDDEAWLRNPEGYDKEHTELTSREAAEKAKIKFDSGKDKAAFDTEKLRIETEANNLRAASPAADTPEAKKLAVLEERLADKNLLSNAERQAYESEMLRISDEYVRINNKRDSLLTDTGAGTSMAERKLELDRLNAEKSRLDAEVKNIEDSIKNAEDKEKANTKAYNKLRDLIRKKSKNAGSQKESDLVDAALNSSSRKVKKDVTVKASDDTEIKIEKGKDVVSLVGRDKSKAEAYAKRAAGPNAKQINKSELAKIMKDSSKVNGAYVAANGTVYVYLQGGQTKYSHLRK